MKNILTTSDCLLNGKPVSSGQRLENVDTATAASLVTSGRAIEITSPEIVSRDPEVETRDPDIEQKPKKPRK